MQTHRQTLHEDSSSLTTGDFKMKQSKCLSDPGGQGHSPAEHTNSCSSEKYTANMDVTEKRGRDGARRCGGGKRRSRQSQK